ncbi:hypothetical protein Smic_83000 [Streptomyces microflavus]|uniref:Uncharacterized protein n=1 Tax=Streptomyces microflavus TaxID=1919 RepID=A0A7J0D6D9_STRMI|nr:hypothetical protein Smic_83000 [Streptomyces microflavus]
MRLQLSPGACGTAAPLFAVRADDAAAVRTPGNPLVVPRSALPDRRLVASDYRCVLPPVLYDVAASLIGHLADQLPAASEGRLDLPTWSTSGRFSR